MLIPWSNTYGAFAGGLAGLIMGCWVTFGNQVAVASGQVHYEKLPMSVEQCQSLYNITTNYTPPVKLYYNCY